MCKLVVGLWKWRRSTLTFKCVSSFCLTENNFEQISPFSSISPPGTLDGRISINLNKLDLSTFLTPRVTLWWATEAPSPLVAICLTSRWLLPIVLFRYFDQVEVKAKGSWRVQRYTLYCVSLLRSKNGADTTDHNNDDDDSSADFIEEGARKLNRAR